MPDELRQREPDHACEPGMPRLSRPYGATILRESDTVSSVRLAYSGIRCDAMRLQRFGWGMDVPMTVLW